MRKGRIDYRLQRRALLRDVAAGLRMPDDVCDAHPDLVRAATHIGASVDDPCPMCHESTLTQVTYVFDGRDNGPCSGRAVPRESLARQVERHGDLSVYHVEVCTDCHWHHLVESYLLQPRDDTAVG